MTTRRRCASSKARSRRCAASSPTSPPTKRWHVFPTTCSCCRPRSTRSPARPATATALRCWSSASRRSPPRWKRASGRRPPRAPNIWKARSARCPTVSTACRSATIRPRPSRISNSGSPICWSGSKPPPIRATAIWPRRGRAARHPAASRTAAGDLFCARRRAAIRRRLPIPAWSIWSSASSPTSASASPRPTAAPRICSRPCTARSAMSSIASR